MFLSLGPVQYKNKCVVISEAAVDLKYGIELYFTSQWHGIENMKCRDGVSAKF